MRRFRNKLRRALQNHLPSNIATPLVSTFARKPIHRPRQTTCKRPGTSNITVAYNTHGGFAIPIASHERPAAQAVLRGSVYEADTIKYIRNHSSAGDVIHAGAFFGDMLPALSDGLSASAFLWSFEPNRENFRAATLTVAINELSNVRLFHAGLGAKSERADITVTDAAGRHLGGRSRFEELPQGKTESVDMVSIDSTVPNDRHVSVIHLDVERFESQAIQGALETIARCHPLLIVENLPNAEMMSSLQTMGYQQVTTIDVNKVLRCE